MHVLFVHQNFPAQFGPFATRLAPVPGWRCTFINRKKQGNVAGVHCLTYEPTSGATNQTHVCARTFENAIWHGHTIYDTLAARPEIQPDLVVGHSGMGPTLFLRELYPKTPIVDLFEYYYHTTDSDMDFRPDFPATPLDKLRARARNAGNLLELDHVDLGYCPTAWQKSRFPAEYQPKLRVLFDGIDTTLWKPEANASRKIGDRRLPDEVRIVTYVSRGMESLRGFDIFMHVADRIARERPGVLFVVVGQDRVCYGDDSRFTGGKTFKEWVISRGNFDLSRFLFTGVLPTDQLARVLAVSDLHIYLTAPFVLSWSMINALACGATVLASDTAPVREVIEHERNGLLANFFDIEGFVRQALRVLDDPGAFRSLGEAGVRLIREKYSLDACLPRFVQLCEDACRLRGVSPPETIPRSETSR